MTRTLLAALLLSLLAPVAQDPGPGRPDDIAELLPEDALFFAELVRAPKILKHWKDYIGAVCTRDGRENICKELEKLVTGALDGVPDKLRKDLETGFPTFQRVGFALVSADGPMPAFAIVATSSDEALFKKIVEEDLKVFAAEERRHQGTLALGIRKLGEMRFPEPLFVAAAGRRLVLSTDWATVCGVLDRAAGKGQGGDLRQNRLYRALGPATGDDPALRAFASMNWSDFGPRYRGYAARRSNVHEMDQIDAILDFMKIRGATAEVTLKPGAVAAQTRVRVDSPCRLYDAFKQPAGPKELLKFIPDNAMLVAHVNLKGGEKIWADVVEMLKRADTVFAKMGRQQEKLLDEFNREMSRELGFEMSLLAGAVGGEVAFAMVGDEPFAGGAAAEKSLLLVVALADAAKAKEVVEKMSAGMGGGYDTEKEGEAALWLAKEERKPSFAISGSTGFLAGSADVLRAALKAPGGLAKALAVDAKTSKFCAMKHAAIWQLLKQAMGADLPDWSRDFNLEAWSTVQIAEEKEYLQLSSVDAGPAALAQSSLLALPLALMAVSVRMPGDMGGGPAVPTLPEPADAAPLPKDQLAEKVKGHVEKLRSEDMAEREAAVEGLRTLGRQTIPLLAEAYRKEADGEAKSRLLDILLAWKAYDALPELLEKKADAFLLEFQKGLAELETRFGERTIVNWPNMQGDASFSPWNLEPYYVNLGFLDRLQHRDILEHGPGMKRLAQSLLDEKIAVETRRQLAAVLAFRHASSAGEAILAAREKTTDADTKTLLTVALGWSPDAKAQEAVRAALKDANRMTSRAAFIAAERSKDPAMVGRLLELVADSDHEVRWNASFTLRRLTRDRAAVNVYLPDDEVKAQIEAALKWWAENKASYKVGAKP